MTTTTIHPPRRGTGLPPSGRLAARFGGATCTRALFEPHHLGALRAEALSAWNQAEHQVSDADDLSDLRGGQPARRLRSAPGGPVQDEGYLHPATSHKLARLVGAPVRPAGGRGSFSYYTDPDDHLALHRDVVTCDLTAITVLHDESSAHDPHGGLLFYPDRCDEPLSRIRERPRAGASVIKAPEGSTIVIAGGEVAHRLLPIAAGTRRVISVLCFEVVG